MNEIFIENINVSILFIKASITYSKNVYVKDVIIALNHGYLWLVLAQI